MNKPKYQVGDRVGNWEVIGVIYANWINAFTYQLLNSNGDHQLHCHEELLDKIVEQTA